MSQIKSETPSILDAKETKNGFIRDIHIEDRFKIKILRHKALGHVELRGPYRIDEFSLEKMMCEHKSGLYSMPDSSGDIYEEEGEYYEFYFSFSEKSLKKILSQYHGLLTLANLFLTRAEDLKITLSEEGQEKLKTFIRELSDLRTKFIQKKFEKGKPEEQFYLYECYEKNLHGLNDPKKAFDFYQLAENKDNVRAKLGLARCYQHGYEIVEKDAKKAIGYYEEVNFRPIPNPNDKLASVWEEANNSLGQCYQRGIGIQKDEEKAFNHYKLASIYRAEGSFVPYYRKNADALNNLGYCYENGIGTTPKDAYEAKKLYGEAYKYHEDHLETIFNIARCHYFGIGVEKDLKEAIWGYHKAAKRGHAAAQNNLGDCYRDGVGVYKNSNQAVYFYELAAKQKYADAQLNLGKCYEFGRDVKKDLVKAMKFYQLAAEQYYQSDKQKYAEVQFLLGQCSEKDESSKSVALRYYEVAVDHKHAEAQCNLGRCYEFEIGVDKDLKEAIKYYRLSAAQENARGQFNLGRCYEEGIGLDKDLKEAARYYQLAANQKNSDAQFNLGRCYEQGIGVTKDPVKAMQSYLLASNQDHIEAHISYGLCHQYGIGMVKNEKKAAFYYILGVRANHPKAHFHLGYCYQEGIGVDKDPKEAVAHYQVAAFSGNASAQYQLGLCYEKGIGIEQNEAQALFWYHNAIKNDKDHKKAKTAFSDLYKKLSKIAEGYSKSDLKKAIPLYERLAEKGDKNSDVRLKLGMCYLKSENKERAKELFGDAAKLGNKTAERELEKLQELMKEPGSTSPATTLATVGMFPATQSAQSTNPKSQKPTGGVPYEPV